MRRSLAIFAMTAVLFVTTAGCANPPTQEAHAGVEYTACFEPRPQVCTMEYDPVCGQMADGRTKTYSNGCSACSDTLVNGYTVGACSASD